MIKKDQRITGRQIAAGRALVGLSQATLAAEARVSVPTLKRMEGSEGEATGMANNVMAVQSALEAAGIVFMDDGETTTGGPGVRLKANQERPAG